MHGFAISTIYFEDRLYADTFFIKLFYKGATTNSNYSDVPACLDNTDVVGLNQ